MNNKYNLDKIVLHDKESEKLKHIKTKNIFPLYGDISCGYPRFLDDEIESYLEIPESMIGQGEFFVLRAKGDSMIGADINNGDLVLVKKQSYAEDGQIVVAFTDEYDEEVVLKRYFELKDENLYKLHPENSEYEDIIVKNCTVIGIAVNVLRDIK